MLLIKNIIKALKSFFRIQKIKETSVKKRIEHTIFSHSFNKMKYDEPQYQDVKDDTNYLSDYEIQTLIDRAENYETKQNYDEALKLFTQLIDYSISGSPYIPFFLSLRSSVYVKLEKWDLAIADTKTSIELNPDAEGNYLSLGAIITWELFYSGNYRIDDNNEILEEAIYYYKESLQRNPLNTVAWLNIMETYIFMQKWDDAISYYGLSKSYMDSEEHKLVRAWIGCLSLALAGDPIEDEDMKPLLDQSTQYESRHDTNQIRDVLLELERIQFDKDKLKEAKYIHELFMNRIKFIEF